jgi:hypothetical protein
MKIERSLVTQSNTAQRFTTVVCALAARRLIHTTDLKIKLQHLKKYT